MSKFPWYVTFEKDAEYEDGTVLTVKDVSFSEPEEGELSYKINFNDKAKFFGGFPDDMDYRYLDLYKLHWWLDLEGVITYEPSIDLDYTRKDLGIPVETNLDLMYTNLVEVVTKMLKMEEEIGDIWKLPDFLDCHLYAQSEATEFLESVLLRVRNKDSRNNKKLEDFDTATEMFDVTMMLIRSLIALEGGKTIDGESEGDRNLRNLVITSNIRKDFLSYKTVRLYPGNESEESIERMLLSEPESLGTMISMLLIYTRQIDQGNDDEQTLTIYHSIVKQYIFTIIEYVVFHPVMQHRGYDNVAKAKLEKIYQKNLAKKQ